MYRSKCVFLHNMQSNVTDSRLHTHSAPLHWFTSVKEHLATGRIVAFTPKGYSMWPAIRPDKDTVYIQPCDVYRKSDIVLAHCSSPYGVVLHRIVDILPDRLILMGDANLYQTELCPLSSVAGKVVGISRNGHDITNSIPQRLLSSLHRLPLPLRRIGVRILKSLFKNKRYLA